MDRERNKRKCWWAKKPLTGCRVAVKMRQKLRSNYYKANYQKLIAKK